MFKRSISTALAGMALAATVHAETVTVTQLTNNTIPDTGFWLNNVGDVSWTSYETGDSEIYLYDADTKSVIAVTNNTDNDTGGILNNQGDLAWIQIITDPNSPTGGTTKIMFRNGVDGVISEITQTPYSIFFLRMNDNGDIVWLGYDVYPGDPEVFRYDGATGTISNISANNTSDYYPVLNERGDVAWLEGSGNSSEIYLYTAATDSVTNISNNNYPETSWYLAINNRGDVAWGGSDGVDSQIYRYDGTTGVTQQLTTANGLYDTNQWLGTNGDVVWNSGNNIVLYTAATQTVTQLTNDTLYRSNAVIDGNGDITWQGMDPNGTDTEMFFYDGTTGVITNISNNDVDDNFYWMNNHGDIAWTSNTGTATEIMFYSNTTKAVTQITNDTFQDNFIVLNDQLDMAWLRNDGDWEVMIGKVETTVPLDFTYARATQDAEDGEIKIRVNSEIPMPTATDQITVSLDGVTVLDVPFSDFVVDAHSGAFEYESAVVEAKLDVADGYFKIAIEQPLAGTIDTSDGVYLVISIGNAVGTGQIQVTPIDDGHRGHDGH
jgi:Tol biopolymer transport system component